MHRHEGGGKMKGLTAIFLREQHGQRGKAFFTKEEPLYGMPMRNKHVKIPWLDTYGT